MGLFDSVLLTADFDGTLTDGKGGIPARNRDAIAYFIEEGGAFTVNTGRSVPMYAPQVGKVPVNAPFLLYNGGAAYDWQEKKLLFADTIPLDLWDTVVRVADAVPEMTVEIQGIDAHYAFRKDPMWEYLNSFLGCPYAYVEPGTDIGPFLKFTLLGPFQEKGSIFDGRAEDPPQISTVVEKVRAIVGDKASVYLGGPRVVDVQAPTASKANSARWLKEKLGRSLLVCVGDGDNDVPMLQGADYAFCPADGIAADRFPNVCRCPEGAVAEVIYKKIPEILQRNT